ncbi:putative Zinc finger, C3HC [Helianthus annuus]|nr:putative Zinc finger, C3HC [Helianthus annuus]KAJ0869312.1 putative Zinc finger, C3HC [Helianthus annuus]
MREEGISSSGDPLLFPNSPPPTAAASSAGASSPAVATNAGSAADWLGHGQGSKAGSLSRVSSQPMWISLSTSAGGLALGSSKPSCRPWERGDLLRRLSTFSPANWFGKPKAASSLSCARRGWVNVDVDTIQCEACGENLTYDAQDSWARTEGENGEEFANLLDEGHNATCPWRGNSCAASLVQFPPTPPSALIGGYKDRCDGLIQFPYLPVVANSALDQMKLSRGLEIDRFLAQSSGYPADIMSDSEISIYLRAQKLISLCGWEPRWLPNVQDCEEHSAQSARNGGSFSPIKDHDPLQDRGQNKKRFSNSARKGSRVRSKFESGSLLLDCSLCGATVRILDFVRVNLPARLAPNNIDVPETSKKMAITRGVSAASAISGWVAADGAEEEQTEDVDEAANSNVRMDLNLTMGSGFSTGHGHKRPISELYQDVNIGRDLVIGQPAGSEVGDRAASYESRGPTTFKRNVDEGGSTVDRPHGLIRQADSVEGVVIDRDGDEINDSKTSTGPSKRACESSSGAGPSQTLYFDIGQAGPSSQGHEHAARASSVIAMDTICHSEDNDSMESVENHPVFIDEVNYPSTSAINPDPNETSDMNQSIQAQQSTCPPAVWVNSEIGVSSTNDDEVLNTETARGYMRDRDGPSLAVSGGSVGMAASHEAEIHGLTHRTESVVGDMEPVTGVTENQGQTGEFVPEEMQQEYSGRGDSGSKVVGSVKGESVESGEKTSDLNLLPHEQNSHPSLSCNAVVYSGLEVSKDEVMQARKSSPNEEYGYPSYPPANGLGPPNGESKFEEPVEFDPIKHHNFFCPWVNGNVAAAGVINSNNGASSSSSALALCGWQLTLDALDGFQGTEQNQTVESESAASLYKVLVKNSWHAIPSTETVAKVKNKYPLSCAAVATRKTRQLFSRLVRQS